jgi:hypothetical protein
MYAKDRKANGLLWFVAIEIDTLAKKYDGVKAESVADCGQLKTSLIADVGHKLTTEIQTAKKELVTLMGKKFSNEMQINYLQLELQYT